MLQFAGAKKSVQRQIITHTRLLAEKYALNANFISAIECYSELVGMLCAFKSKAPNELGNAYRDFAAANLARAGQLYEIDPSVAELHRAQGVLQIQQALLSYPSTATQQLDFCKSQLNDLTIFPRQVHVEEEDVDVEIVSVGADADASIDVDVEALSSVEEIMKQNPAVLHWKKTLLQRYNAEQSAANNALPAETDTNNHRVINKR